MQRLIFSITLVLLFNLISFGQHSSVAAPTSLKHIKANGIKITYLEMGKGEPVIFVHGALGDYRSWAAQMKPFAKNYRVISYSRRYHYPNQWIGDGSNYSRVLHAADLIAFIQALKLPHVHLIGHSYGGSVAAIAAFESPELVWSLVLVEPSLFTLLAQDEEGKDLVSKQTMVFRKVVELLDRGEKGRALSDFINLVDGLGGYDRLRSGERAKMMDNLRTLKPTLIGNRRVIPFTCENAASIKAPTLLLQGEHSPRIFHLTLTKFATCLPKAKSMTLKGVSHFLASEDSQTFNKVALKFLSENQVP
jgi:non-heme chloroperoxidase